MSSATRPDRARVLRWIFIFLVTVAIPAGFVILAVYENPELSPLDEVAHLDYLDRAGDGSIARMGDTVSSEIAVLSRCRDLEVEEGIDCDEVVVPDGPVAAADGYSYQAQHPPLYYWVSAGVQRVAGVGPADNFITTGRLTGILWLVAGTIALYAALRKLDVDVGVSGAVCVFLAASPGVVFSVSKVTNDATSVLAGAGLLLAYLHTRERPGLARVTLLCAVAVGVVLLKPVNVIAVGSIAVAALFDLAPSIGWRGALARTAAISFAGVATVLGWQVAVDALAHVDTDIVMDALLDFKAMSDGPPIGRFVLSAGGLLAAYEAGHTVVGTGAATFAVVNRLALVGAAITAGIRGHKGVATVLGVSAVVVSIAAGAAFNIQFWATFGLRDGPAARYGLSLLPLLAAPMAVAASRSRRGTIGVWIAAVTMAVGSIVGIVLDS